jgi:hypothetical protein
VEGWANWSLTPAWRVSVGGNYLRKDLKLAAGSRDFFGTGFAGNDPSYQISVRSYALITDDLDLYIGVRAVGALPAPAVSAFVEADATLTWHLTPSLSVAATGLNLLHDRHTEFVLNGIAPVAVSRSAYLTLKTAF